MSNHPSLQVYIDLIESDQSQTEEQSDTFIVSRLTKSGEKSKRSADQTFESRDAAEQFITEQRQRSERALRFTVNGEEI